MEKNRGEGRDTPQNNSRTHILLKCTWNIPQDRPKQVSINFITLKSYTVSSPITIKLEIKYRGKKEISQICENETTQF